MQKSIETRPYHLASRVDSGVSPLRRSLSVLPIVASPLIVVIVWLATLQRSDTNNISDLGLVTALPPLAFAALFLLVFSFSIALTRQVLRVPILLLHVLALIFTLYGAAILIEGAPRTAIAWKMVGIMDQVLHHGSVDPTRDAFQNWPGFFILGAFVDATTGIQNLLTLAAWAHVFFNLLYLGPLLLLFSSATQDKRLIWLGVWLFYLNNWIGQDYLAPQAFGYLIYLVTLGILLNWFQNGSRVWVEVKEKLQALPVWRMFGRRPVLNMGVSQRANMGKQLVGLTAMLMLFLVVLTPSHQLTPVAILVSVTALILFKRITPRGLPIFLGVLIVAWISYMAVPFVRGHLSVFIEPFGALTSNIKENLTDRVRGGADHVFIVLCRIYVTLFVCALASLGFIRRLRNGYLDVNFGLLALVPFSLLAFQTYGGELLLRSYLFALPFVAFFMAALFFPRPGVQPSIPLMLTIFSISTILVMGFFFIRYGNERMDYFRPGEIEAVNYVYDHARPGSQIVAGTDMLPWRSREYNTYTYSVVTNMIHDNDIDQLVKQMSSGKYPESYLILTRSQQASAELLFNWPPGTWEHFEASLLASKKFKLVFWNVDARVYMLASH